jgi:tetratricopeptide (TPR) repeat protein
LDVNLLVNHGHALKGQGHLDEAEALYRRAMILKPEDADLTVQMGQVYKLRGQFSLARRAFRKAQVIGGEVGTKELAELDRFERERDIARSNELARVSNLQTPRALSPDARGIYLRLGHLTSVTEKDRTKGRH